MTPWELPRSIRVAGRDYDIETDFRTVLYVLNILGDPDYEQDEQAAVMIMVMVRDWESLDAERYEEALEELSAFIDAGVPEEKANRPRSMDWEQDAPIIIPAVNRVLGQEIRAMPYLHWWTFLGAYMEIGECLFSTVLRLRQKRAAGRKLEKPEVEFVQRNKSLMALRPRETEAERERREALKKLFR